MTAIKNGTLLVKDSNGNTARVATLSQTDITTLNTALTDIGTNSVSIQSLTNQVKTIQGRYVDVDTQQTITGRKCFETEFSAVQLRDPTIDVNVLPAQGKEFGHYLYFFDKNNKTLGIVKAALKDTGATEIGMFTTTPTASNEGPFAGIHVRIKPDGTGETETIRPTDSANGNEIATTGWSNSRYVSLTDAQTITGLKYFTQPPYLRIPSEDLNAPSKTFSTPFTGCLDKAGLFISGLNGGLYKKNGSNIPEDMSVLQLVCGAGSVNNTDGIIAEFQKDHTSVGSKRAYSPSNIAHTYLTEIATVDWVVQRANINDIVAWKIANGLCISVVQLVTVAGQMSTYTYPIPYAVTPVTAGCVLGIVAPNANAVPQFYCSITDLTPTSFKCGFVRNGFLEQGLISVISIGVPA